MRTCAISRKGLCMFYARIMVPGCQEPIKSCKRDRHNLNLNPLKGTKEPTFHKHPSIPMGRTRAVLSILPLFLFLFLHIND